MTLGRAPDGFPQDMSSNADSKVIFAQLIEAIKGYDETHPHAHITPLTASKGYFLLASVGGISCFMMVEGG